MSAPVAAAPARVAVIGNPNTGKTTLVNALTGLSLRVGNYPGVTVERKEGTLHLADRDVALVDLPGTYSLAPRSPDELIAVDELLRQQAGSPPVAAVIAVVDAAALERNLYLVTQLLEVGLPVVVALNRVDLAEAEGIAIEVPRLAERLGVPVVPTVARRSEGLEALRAAVSAALAAGTTPTRTVAFPAPFAAEVDALTAWFATRRERIGRVVTRFEATRVLVDADGEAETRAMTAVGPELREVLVAARARAGAGRPPIMVEAHTRYAWIREAIGGLVIKRPRTRGPWTERLDAVLTHRVWGLVCLVLILGLTFQAIYTWAAPLMDLVEGGVGFVGAAIASALPEGILRSFVADACFGGVGAVVVFVPQIAMLFLLLSILEDTGYLTRVAFLLDKLLVKMGLSGRSVMPLLSSFACAIPGVMATRTIDDRRERLATMLVAPLMSCSARLPVYTILIATCIPDTAIAGPIGAQGLVMLAMYAVGVLVAIPVVRVLKATVLRGSPAPFVMELPPYTWPAWRTVARRVWDRSYAFLRRAGTLIFAVTVIVWTLMYFPRPAAVAASFEPQRAEARATLAGEPLEGRLAAIGNAESGAYLRQSLFGRMGQGIEPLVKPLGWDWRIGMATIAAFPAREVVVSVLGTTYNLGGEVDAGPEGSRRLRDALQAERWPDGRPIFTIATGLSVMVFFALCAQCASTLVVIRRESGAWKWAGLAFAYMTGLAYLGALVTYQGAAALGLG